MKNINYIDDMELRDILNEFDKTHKPLDTFQKEKVSADIYYAKKSVREFSNKDFEYDYMYPM